MNKKLIMLVVIILLFAASNCYALDVYGGAQISSINEDSINFNPSPKVTLDYPVLGVRKWVTEELALGAEYNYVDFIGDIAVDDYSSIHPTTELSINAYLVTLVYKMPIKMDLKIVSAVGAYQSELSYYTGNTDTQLGYKLGLESEANLNSFDGISIINSITYRDAKTNLNGKDIDISGVEFTSVLKFEI